jgi:hypothetical protein
VDAGEKQPEQHGLTVSVREAVDQPQPVR